LKAPEVSSHGSRALTTTTPAAAKSRTARRFFTAARPNLSSAHTTSTSNAPAFASATGPQ
jgi:hypothetical protein